MASIDMRRRPAKASSRAARDAATRSSIIARGDYTFYYGDKHLSGYQDAEVSFAVPQNPYGDIANQTGATNRAARLLAKKSVDDLRLKLAAD